MQKGELTATLSGIVAEVAGMAMLETGTAVIRVLDNSGAGCKINLIWRTSLEEEG